MVLWYLWFYIFFMVSYFMFFNAFLMTFYGFVCIFYGFVCVFKKFFKNVFLWFLTKGGQTKLFLCAILSSKKILKHEAENS